MPTDIRQVLNTIVHFVKSRANQVCTAPCDGLILKMHYRWTFFIMIGGFLTVWYNWYYRDVITCVSKYNADTQVRLDYINICLSYPFIKNNGDDDDRRYLPFYRWVHWSFLLLAGVYYIPRKFSKTVENVKVKKLLEDLAHHAPHYEKVDKDLMEKAARYVFINLKTHNKLYVSFITANIVAFCVDVACMLFLDFLIQGRFLHYGIKAFPFHRDFRTYTDFISQTFPPFADCEIEPVNKLVDDRVEKFGCHLTVMELYEKIFFVLWVWIVLLLILTLFYILFLTIMLVPSLGKYVLLTSKPVNGGERVRQTVDRVCDKCKVGDIYLLYRLKQHLSNVRFYELLIKIGDLEVNKFSRQNSYVDPTLLPNSKLRKRNPNSSSSQVPHMSPDYLKLLIPDPQDKDTSEKEPNVPNPNPQTAPVQQQPRRPQIGFTNPKGAKNTSILIE